MLSYYLCAVLFSRSLPAVSCTYLHRFCALVLAIARGVTVTVTVTSCTWRGYGRLSAAGCGSWKALNFRVNGMNMLQTYPRTSDYPLGPLLHGDDRYAPSEVPSV